MKALAIRGTQEVQLLPDALTERDNLVRHAATITEVADELDQHDCVESLKALKYVVKTTEESRKAVKAPVIDLGRKIDGLSEEFLSPVTAEVSRLTRLLTAFEDDRRRKAAEEERKRLAELERLEDEKRKADAELKRAEELQRKLDESAFLDDAPKAADVTTDVVTPVRLAVAQAESNLLQATVAIKTATAPKPAGLSVREVWKFEVTDFKALYAARPELCRVEANTEAINAVIKTGAEIPGVRAWKETAVGVRT